jgi:hypothetical protein
VYVIFVQLGDYDEFATAVPACGPAAIHAGSTATKARSGNIEWHKVQHPKSGTHDKYFVGRLRPLSREYRKILAECGLQFTDLHIEVTTKDFVFERPVVYVSDTRDRKNPGGPAPDAVSRRPLQAAGRRGHGGWRGGFQTGARGRNAGIFFATTSATLFTAKMRVLSTPTVIKTHDGNLKYSIDAELFVYSSTQRKEMPFPISCIVDGSNKRLAPVWVIRNNAVVVFCSGDSLYTPRQSW